MNAATIDGAAPADRRSDPPPSGLQYTITYGEQVAVVTRVGATLRDYTVSDHHVIDGFDGSRRATDGRGQVLAPWPNRLAAGRYTFGGREVQAPLNEPDPGNAIHGLVRWLDWTEIGYTADEVTLGCDIHPQPGYEWQLSLRVGYRLGQTGLTVSATALNTGTEPAPFGIGFHPYLTLGTDIDRLRLQLPSETRVSASDPDLVPEAIEVSSTSLDFRTATLIGATQLDMAFGRLHRDQEGRAVAELSDPENSRCVRLWVDHAFPYLMVYTADQVRDPDRRRRAVAVEPMSCPPNAFRSGADVVTLGMGESWRGEWGLTALAERP